MAADIDRLMNTVIVRCPGATTSALQLELFSVMDKFFKESNLWQEDIDFNVIGGDPAGTVYQLTPSDNAIIDKLMWCFSVPTEPNIRRGVAVGVTMSTPGEIILAQQPSSDDVYRATVALTVADPTQRDGYVSFPKWVLDKYRSVIFDGLVGSMMSQPNKPFTNTQLSVYHLRKFNSGVSQARVDGLRNNVYRAQAWRYPSFAGGSQRGGGGFFPPQ